MIQFAYIFMQIIEICRLYELDSVSSNIMKVHIFGEACLYIYMCVSVFQCLLLN